MKTKLATLAALVALGLSGCGGAGTGGGSTEYQPYDAPPISDAQKKEFLDAVNAARATGRSCGSEGWFDAAPALKWDDRLYRAAAEHANDLSLHDEQFEHTGSGTEDDWTATVLNLGRGSESYERMRNNGIDKKYTTGENIAAGYSRNETKDAINAWLNSDGHCANMMDREYKTLGMAHSFKDGTKWGNYWVQNFSSATPE